MPRDTRRALLAGAAAMVVAPAHAQHRHAEPMPRPRHSEPLPGPSPQAEFAGEMHHAMKAMREAMDAVPMSGDPDRDFLAMMIPHHQGAIDMARLVLIHGRDPLVRQLAEEIIAAQQAEIRSMTARLRVLESGKPADADGFPALSGTRG